MEMVNYPKIGRFYKHYKGGTYKVLFMTKHSETDEILVCHQSTEWGTYHVRPLTKWEDNVNKTPDEDGRVVYRFVLIEDQK